jgi:hypothetical protein
MKIMLIIIIGDTNVMMLGVIQKDGKETPWAKVTGVMVREVAAKAKVSGSVAKERVGVVAKARGRGQWGGGKAAGNPPGKDFDKGNIYIQTVCIYIYTYLSMYLLIYLFILFYVFINTQTVCIYIYSFIYTNCIYIYIHININCLNIYIYCI